VDACLASGCVVKTYGLAHDPVSKGAWRVGDGDILIEDLPAVMHQNVDSFTVRGIIDARYANVIGGVAKNGESATVVRGGRTATNGME